MPQRRAVNSSPKDGVKTAEEMVPFSESLEATPPSSDTDGGVVAMSLDERYDAETLHAKQKSWIDGPFAAGDYESTWNAEYARFRSDPYRQCLQSTQTDGAPCNCCSAFCCGMLGAGRVGHMAVLKQSVEVVEESVEEGDGDDQEPTTRRYKRPKLDIVIGPYWPMLFCVTYPLIFGVSGLTLVTAIPKANPAIQLFWVVCTLGLIYALAMTAFKDPGILPRHLEPPGGQQWNWSEKAYSFRPRGAYFDPDTGVIVEGFDHTCPWTGTAIGKKNMPAFQMFVGLIFFCLIFDIILLTGGIRS
mmetsp:Transcript_22972/g.65093  ORF Transcript_22972/g.65093 Transcript_22972/m.65093 type:complete len:302 (-) Transcript_22972:1011-1916(-)